MMLTGNNGILNRAGEARGRTGEEQIIEQAKLDILSIMTKKNSSKLTEGELRTILEDYGSVSRTDGYSLKEEMLITSNGKYNIPVSKIYNGVLVTPLKPGETAKTTETDNYTDSHGKTATVPAGFTISNVKTSTKDETSIDSGLVIKKGSDEYVWIEVPRSIYTDSNYTIDLTANPEGKKEVTSDTDYDGIYKVLNRYAYTYREGSAGQGYYWVDEWFDKYNRIATARGANLTNAEGCGLTSENYTKQYQRMLESVYTNGGFWIGRYEAGITTARTSRIVPELSPTPMSQSSKPPYTYVYCSDAQILATRVATEDTNNANSVNYTSSLMFGIQWDLVCKFLEGSSEWDTSVQTAVQYINTNSSSWGVYNKSSKSNTGSSTSPITKRRNIYDFAGNVLEWTLEHVTVYSNFACSNRGGYYGLSGKNLPASFRDYSDTTSSYYHVRFPCFTLLIELSTV